MTIPQWVRNLLDNWASATEATKQAYRLWASMQSPMAMVMYIGRGVLEQTLGQREFERIYGSLDPQERAAAAQAEVDRLMQVSANATGPSAAAFEQQLNTALNDASIASLNLAIYNGDVTSTDQIWGYLGITEADYQNTLNDPLMYPPPEGFEFLFETAIDPETGATVTALDQVFQDSQEYIDAQKALQVAMELRAENQLNMENLYTRLEESGINPDIYTGIALQGNKEAIAAQLGFGAPRTGAQENAGVWTPRGQGSFGMSTFSSNYAAPDSYSDSTGAGGEGYVVTTQPDLNVQRNLAPQGYQGPANTFQVGVQGGNMDFNPYDNPGLASHGDPNPSRNLTSGNLPMSIAQLSSGVYQSANRSVAESNLSSMYFDLTDEAAMTSYLGTAAYAGIPFDVAIGQLIAHNQQYHGDQFNQDIAAAGPDFNPFDTALQIVQSDDSFSAAIPQALAENLATYTTPISEIIQSTQDPDTGETETFEQVETQSPYDSGGTAADDFYSSFPEDTTETIDTNQNTTENAPMANNVFTPQQLVDRHNDSAAAQDFGISATYDPDTNTFIQDVSSFGFTGDAATKTFTPEEFLNQLGLGDGVGQMLDPAVMEYVDQALSQIEFPTEGFRTDEEIQALFPDVAGQISEAIDGIEFPPGVTTEQINSAVGTYLTNNNYVTSDQLPDVSNFLTEADVAGFLTADDLPGETDTSDFLTRDEAADLIQQAQLEGASDLYTADELIDFHNSQPSSQDFGITATYDPETNTFIQDVSSFGFTGDAATKEFTPEEFMEMLGYTDGQLVEDLAEEATSRITLESLGGLTTDQVQELIDTGRLTTDDVKDIISANPNFTEEDILTIAQGAGYTHTEIDELFATRDTAITGLGTDLTDLETALSQDITELETDLVEDITGLGEDISDVESDIETVEGKIDLVEETFDGALSDLKNQHDEEIRIINEQLAEDIPALQEALDTLSDVHQQDIDNLTIAYTDAIEAAQTETTDNFLEILKDYTTGSQLEETLQDYYTTTEIDEFFTDYVSQIQNDYEDLLDRQEDLKDQIAGTDNQYQIEALSTQLDAVTDELNAFLADTGYDPSLGTVDVRDINDSDLPSGGGGPDGTGGGGGGYGGPDGTGAGDYYDPDAGTGTTTGGSGPGGGGPGGGGGVDNGGPGGGGGGGGGGDDLTPDPTEGRTYPDPNIPQSQYGIGFLGNQIPARRYQQGYDPYTRPGPPAPLAGITALTQPLNRPRRGEPVNPMYNPQYNYPYPYDGAGPEDSSQPQDSVYYEGTRNRRYYDGGQVQDFLGMSMNQMMDNNNQGIGSLVDYQTNVAPFQEAFRPNVRRYNR